MPSAKTVNQSAYWEHQKGNVNNGGIGFWASYK